MKDGGYAWEKLHTAVLILAGGSGNLRDRLENAYVSSLMRLFNPEHQFPWPDERRRFVGIMEDLAPDGDFRTALANWDELDLKRIAEDIVGLYDRVARQMGTT